MEVDDEACPSTQNHGSNRRKTPQITRSKIGPKIHSKSTKMKNLTTQDKRWFNPKTRMHWYKLRVYNVWKPPQHPPTLWRIGGISRFLSSPLLYHEAHPLIGYGCPDLPTSSNNSRFGGDETQIDPASEQHILNPAIATPCLLWLLTVQAQSTSPRRLILAYESKNMSMNIEE
jgi:hypothetical protein